MSEAIERIRSGRESARSPLADAYQSKAARAVGAVLQEMVQRPDPVGGVISPLPQSLPPLF